jgi:hypothetical protein
VARYSYCLDRTFICGELPQCSLSVFFCGEMSVLCFWWWLIPSHIDEQVVAWCLGAACMLTLIVDGSRPDLDAHRAMDDPSFIQVIVMKFDCWHEVDFISSTIRVIPTRCTSSKLTFPYILQRRRRAAFLALGPTDPIEADVPGQNGSCRAHDLSDPSLLLEN